MTFENWPKVFGIWPKVFGNRQPKSYELYSGLFTHHQAQKPPRPLPHSQTCHLTFLTTKTVAQQTMVRRGGQGPRQGRAGPRRGLSTDAPPKSPGVRHRGAAG